MADRDPIKNDQLSSNEDVNPDKGQPKKDEYELTEVQLAKAFEHPRFKELAIQAQELKKLKEKLAEEEEAKLKEKEEYKILAEQKDAENTALKKQIIESNKKQALITQAIAQGVRKEALEDVVHLVDLESVHVDENGNVSNAETIIKSLLTTKSYLLAESNKLNMGTPNTSGQNGNAQMWKWSDIQKKSHDHKWYEENKTEIDKAKREGRINYHE